MHAARTTATCFPAPCSMELSLLLSGKGSAADAGDLALGEADVFFASVRWWYELRQDAPLLTQHPLARQDLWAAVAPLAECCSIACAGWKAIWLKCAFEGEMRVGHTPPANRPASL